MGIKINNIEALEILDSGGDPTLEVTVELVDGTKEKASVPSGASTGIFEAYELRDTDPIRYGGKGVDKAVRNVNTTIRDILIGHDASDQRSIDLTMIDADGTDNKQSFGANAILGVSLATARAVAASQKMSLFRYIRLLTKDHSDHYEMPIPFINVINGGKHASSNLDLQEFWVIPTKAPEFKERIRQGSEIFHALAQVLEEAGKDTDVGNEGGYAPNLRNHKQAYDFILQAIERSSLSVGDDIWLGMDAGSSVLFDTVTKKYKLKLEHAEYTSSAFIDYFMELVDKYPILALEDPLSEEEWTGWQELTAKLAQYNKDIKLIGDDLFVTNTKRLEKGIKLKVANSILIKPNQIGTLTETLDCIAMAKENGYSTAISHRSGETTDTFIADLAVAVNSEFIKTGSTARGERMAKYNRLLEIEHELNS